MPDLQENYAAWNELHPWEQQGEEWSEAWGGSEAQWHFALEPRLHAFLPAEHILEIAPGYGRWTQYLLRYCRHLSVVDLSDKCIEACRQRFKAETTISYYVNDGLSLAMIADGSCDLIFTFDSLVHAEMDVIGRYLPEMAQKLTPTGVVFLHHSNLKNVPALAALAPHMSTHWRAPSVSAEQVRAAAETAGLSCISQELINWGGTEYLDCLTVLTRPGSRLDRPYRRLENPSFMLEAALIKRSASLYSFRSIGRVPPR
jgi:SAM-dependent methyltransferase